MASSRRKQDEKNLKTLRELGTLPSNKYCFDCNQRGPTYVNVTIGSFVCTKCSGMLRGITPPHRVKSISMATFTNEEIDLLKNRGNDYCKQVWLGLYEGTPPSYNGDETIIRDFMVEKYEKRRYYLDPVNVKAVEETKTPKINGVQVVPTQRPRPEANKLNTANRNSNGFNGFVVDFDKADIFVNGLTHNHNQTDFANFENNFNNVNVNNGATTGLPIPSITNGSNNNNAWISQNNGIPVAPVEDRYAALKDLDNEFKSQKNGSLDWTSSASANSSSSNGSLYNSPTPTGSLYSSPSSQGSIFGSPSQSHFLTAFPPNQDPNHSNPFNLNGGFNWSNNGVTNSQSAFANPFRDNAKTNGLNSSFQNLSGFPSNGTNVIPVNPFKVGGATAVNSNNPFL